MRQSCKELVISKLESERDSLAFKLSIIELDEESFTEDRGYTTKAHTNITALGQAIDGLNCAIANLKDFVVDK